MRAIIETTPEGPVFRAAQYIELRCKVVTPGNYQFVWKAYCEQKLIYQSGQFTTSDDTSGLRFSSTPDVCVDVVLCRAVDGLGTIAEDKFYSENITG